MLDGFVEVSLEAQRNTQVEVRDVTLFGDSHRMPPQALVVSPKADLVTRENPYKTTTPAPAASKAGTPNRHRRAHSETPHVSTRNTPMSGT